MKNPYIYSLSKKYFALIPTEEEKSKAKQSYLKKVGFYKGIDSEKIIEGRINPDNIETWIANTNEIRFEVTENCNLSCKYCCYSDIYNNVELRKTTNLSIEYAFHLLDYLFKIWNSFRQKSLNKPVTFTFYGGEALLNVDFIKAIIDYIKNANLNNIKPNFYIITNALLLKKNIHFLIEHDFNILISLDGNEQNNGYRVFKNGQPAFKNIIENIDYVYHTYPDYFKNKINFNSVLHNKNNVKEIMEYIYNRYNKNTSITELELSNINELKKDEFWNKYRNLNEELGQIEDYRFLRNEFMPNLKNFQYFVFDYMNYVYKSYVSFFNSETEKQNIPTGTCYPFLQKIFLTAKGFIMPCEKISHQYKLGYIDSKGVSLDPIHVSNFINKYFDNISVLCKSCIRLGKCRQCMYFLNLDNYPIICKGYKSKEELNELFDLLMVSFSKQRKLYKDVLKTLYM